MYCWVFSGRLDCHYCWDYGGIAKVVGDLISSAFWLVLGVVLLKLLKDVLRPQ